jgi:hypothetical protein
MMMTSKSEYMMFLKHPAWLWYKKHDNKKLPPVDDQLQAMFDAGNIFERYAEELFPEGIHLGFNSFDEYRSLSDRTTRAIHDGAKTIYQGRFEHEQLTFICDVLQIVDENTVDLTEIKSSTSVKKDHKKDLAFQMIVLEGCGYEVRNISVAHVDNTYVRDGDIDPKKITAITDVTDSVKKLREVTKEQAKQALIVASSDVCPDPSPVHAKPNAFKDWLSVYKTHMDIEHGSIFELGQLNIDQYSQLEAEGITKLVDISNDFKLRPKQALQLETTKLDHPIVHKERIEEFLNNFEFPLYFLDYETMGSVIPCFDGMQPYKQYPFQYSLHILDSPEAELRHVEFLHADPSNPIKPLSKMLKSHIGGTGTVITWNMRFETGCNDMMGSLLPEYESFYKDLNERIVDLGYPFAQSWYVHKDFKTSWSIKNVLPVLLPELSYKDLAIQDGTAAQRIWMATVLDGDNNDERKKILEDLIEYCKLDTLAMVEIWRVLKKL